MSISFNCRLTRRRANTSIEMGLYDPAAERCTGHHNESGGEDHLILGTVQVR